MWFLKIEHTLKCQRNWENKQNYNNKVEGLITTKALADIPLKILMFNNFFEDNLLTHA
jgi:hypothetical protein